MKSLLPNTLTLMRLVLAPIVAWCMWKGFEIPYLAEFGPNALDASVEDVQAAQAKGDCYKYWAAGLFVFAAFTDLFDGMAARAFDADSKFGRILDPIADKALVALPLLMVAAIGYHSEGALNWIILAPILTIIGRDLLITVLRLFAADGEGVQVSFLAKIKTTLELIAVAMPIFLALPLIGASTAMNTAWLGLLWAAAALSVLTALQYFLAPANKTEDN